MAASSLGNEPCVFTRRRNYSWLSPRTTQHVERPRFAKLACVFSAAGRVCRRALVSICVRKTRRPASSCGRNYSTSRSARPITDWGSVNLNAFAVLRLMRNSNRVGCSTGSSAGFAPLSILSA